MLSTANLFIPCCIFSKTWCMALALLTLEKEMICTNVAPSVYLFSIHFVHTLAFH